MAQRRRIPAEQRIFSLVLALVASPEGVTKRGLLASVYGYSDRFDPSKPDAALDRQFERDKDQLRALGVPVETIDSPQEPGNTQLARYRISKDLLQMPEGLRFTPRELTLLRMAALAWAEGSLTAESRRAAMKLEALGASVDVRHLGVAPRIGPPDPTAQTLWRAIEELRVVRFDYRLPSRERSLTRRVAPLRLHRADGRWHLIGRDLDRAADRVFLLSRIVGDVTLTSARFSSDLLAAADTVVSELLEREGRQLATVAVAPGSVAEARLVPRAREVRPRDSEDPAAGREIVLGTLDYLEHALADELVAYGDEVVVVGPPELRSAVADRLRGIAEAHRVEPEEVRSDG